jgi:hypothetical protein
MSEQTHRDAPATPATSEPQDVGKELPDHWGHWLDKNGNHWWIFGKPGKFMAQCLDPETGMPDDELPSHRFRELTSLRGNWRPVHPTPEVAEQKTVEHRSWSPHSYGQRGNCGCETCVRLDLSTAERQVAELRRENERLRAAELNHARDFHKATGELIRQHKSQLSAAESTITELTKANAELNDKLKLACYLTGPTGEEVQRQQLAVADGTGQETNNGND